MQGIMSWPPQVIVNSIEFVYDPPETSERLGTSNKPLFFHLRLGRKTRV